MYKITFVLFFWMVLFLVGCADQDELANASFNDTLRRESNYEATTMQTLNHTVDGIGKSVGAITNSVGDALAHVDQREIERSFRNTRSQMYDATYGNDVVMQYVKPWDSMTDSERANYGKHPVYIRGVTDVEYEKKKRYVKREKNVRNENEWIEVVCYTSGSSFGKNIGDAVPKYDNKGSYNHKIVAKVRYKGDLNGKLEWAIVRFNIKMPKAYYKRHGCESSWDSADGAISAIIESELKNATNIRVIR